MPIGGPSHIGGIVSGMDTQSMVNDLMKIEQLKLDRVYRNRTTQEWKLEAYNNINKSVRGFRETYFSALSPKNVLTSSAYNSFDIKMTDNSAIRLSTSGSVVARKLEIYGVKKATSASVTNNKTVGDPNYFTTNRVEKSGETQLVKTSITGSKSDITDITKTLGDFKDDDGNNLFGLTGSLTEGEFTINGKSIKFEATDTVQNLVDKVNGTADIGAKMSFVDGKFNITANKLGADTELKLENVKGTAFTANSLFAKPGGLGIVGATYNYTNGDRPKGVKVEGAETLFESGEGKTVDAMKFSLNGVDFEFEAGTAVKDVMKAVNQSDAGVKMTLTDKKITLESTRSGTNSGINIVDVDGKAFGASGEFGINSGLISPTAENKPYVTADTKLDGLNGFSSQNTTVKINGTEINLTLDADSTVQDLIDQVETAMTVGGKKTVLMRFDEKTGSFSLRSNDNNVTKIEVEDVDNKIFGEGSLTGINTDADDKGAISSIKLTDTLATVAYKATGQSVDSTTNGMFEFVVNGKTLRFSEDTTLRDMLQAVNGTDSKVQMNYSQINDAFTISDKTTGTKSKVEISGKGFDMLGLGQGVATSKPSGTDAEITVSLDGAAQTTIVQPTNNFTMDGITFNIQADYVMDPDPTKAKPIVADFAYNTDKVVQNVKDFITDYNKLIDELSGMITESKSKNDKQYGPLTPAEKESMDAKDIEAWEKKAKIGLMRNDNDLSNLLGNLRSSVYSVVGGTGLSASSLGITTRSWTSEGGTAYGQLELSAEGEKKLRDQLNSNPDVVQQVFAGVSFASDPAQKKAESGMFNRMSNTLNEFTNNIRNINIKSVNEYLDNSEKTISDMIRKMAVKEQNYWNQFTRMEKALSQLQSQSSYFTSMLGG